MGWFQFQPKKKEFFGFNMTKWVYLFSIVTNSDNKKENSSGILLFFCKRNNPSIRDVIYLRPENFILVKYEDLRIYLDQEALIIVSRWRSGDCPLNFIRSGNNMEVTAEFEDWVKVNYNEEFDKKAKKWIKCT